MKKIIPNFILAIATAIIFSGCMALHQGYMANSTALGAANFSYVTQNAQGTSTATYIVFGLGGVRAETLVSGAKQKLLETYPLKSNQALANVTVDFQTTLWFPFGLFVSKIKCTVTADIVEFK